MDMNFHNIRTHEGSKHSGFEELVCQLAHLEKPQNGKRFVKKEGAGGDAGVECYWVLSDGAEICWQAKYFPDGMNSSRWQQLDESFSTALEKHPHLKEYVVSMPLDKADSRKVGRGGAKVSSVEDEWLAHVEKWRNQATAVGRDIEFRFWGKHEITILLSNDDPKYSGRALYWFNEPALSLNSLKGIAQRSKESLGERYTPEFHVELPIAKEFDGLCLNSSWWETAQKTITSFREAWNETSRFLSTAKTKSGELLYSSEKLKDLESAYDSILNKLEEGCKHKDLHKCRPHLSPQLERLVETYRQACEELYERQSLYEGDDYLQGRLYKFADAIQGCLDSLFQGRKCKAANSKAMLLYGEAGIGKSHLLCDISVQRLEQKRPTLFLLGAQYRGGNPIGFLKESLDLGSYRNSQVLGALDAIGEATGERALIVIDAINEGSCRDDWHDFINSFLGELSEFDNLGVLLSCRTTYLNYLLPDSVSDQHLVRVHHFGFQGFEHRAAEQFLSKQGISKPSAPIIAPEFTNPLFLKTCCKALKQNGQTTFPKGLNSITSLFNFYVSSIERVVAKKKRYNEREQIVQAVLIDIASKLLPDCLEGLPKHHARQMINTYDPCPNRGDSLFDILIDEGILAEDVSYKAEDKGHLVIRFTYERFSDYFIAQELLKGEQDVETAFSEEGKVYRLLEDNGYYEKAGIFEALALVIAEKYNQELVDLIPEQFDIAKWQLDECFQNTVIWRSPESFTKRTLEILNDLEGYRDEALFILLKLSTEPDHPWNAQLLHRNLSNKEVAERDYSWSIQIAYGDSSEAEDEHESIIRTIIEWAYSGDISSVEKERIRLCSIILFWFLTTPNRKVRDRATKSLVRLLATYPDLLPDLLREFSQVNDTYLTERLYAVAYGVVSNISDSDVISKIATVTFELVFENGAPAPHLLLRDYARGVLELALSLESLPQGISASDFRPPYQSDSIIENPSEEDIKALEGDEFSSRIKSSLMGFPGDFGNYTMGCVHRWSSTPLSAAAIESAREIKKRFAEEHLSGEVLEEFLRKIQPVTPKSDSSSLEELMKSLSSDSDPSEYRKSFDEQREEQESFDARVKTQIEEDEYEYYRWIMGAGDDRPAAFSRKWAQRWVCQRAHEYGWKEELFGQFEQHCSYGRGGGPGGGAMERVGKKYQWMALFEFLALLADNYYWIGNGYSDVESEEYEGPWQIHKRDIDPTIWARNSGEYKTYHNRQCTWWQPYSFPFPKEGDLTIQQDFLWDEKIMPPFPDLLERVRPSDNTQWRVLHGFWSEHQKDRGDVIDAPYLDAWFRINAIFIRKGEFEALAKGMADSSLCDPHIVSCASNNHEGFLGEYPWHPIYSDVDGWRKADSAFRDQIVVDHFVPFCEYEWEDASNDYSLDSSLHFYMPSKELIEDLGLVRAPGRWGNWYQGEAEVFIDPCLEEYGPAYALMRSDVVKQWLDEHDMEMAWLIGGEKQLFSSDSHQFYGRLVYSGLYKKEDEGVDGVLWFKKEMPT
ncbi:MAG: hypothetical protein K6L74_17165 [Neptuniibacter sp.]